MGIGSYTAVYRAVAVVITVVKLSLFQADGSYSVVALRGITR
jgi:hypothetical protein